jgi:deoxyribonuclease V
MRATLVHEWDVSPREAMQLQRELAGRVVRRGELPATGVRLIAGADVAFDRPSKRAIAAVSVLSYPGLEVVEQVAAEAPVSFPYVPGLLSFRETPALLPAFERLSCSPDLVMADGHGFAHPRRFGFACHLGLLLDVPTIGIAKSRLVGTHGSVGEERGASADLMDGSEVIGALVRTRARVRPVYVSVGHRISLNAAERWALACARMHRLPEPARLADRLTRAAKRRMLDATIDVVIEQRAGEAGRWEWVADDDIVVFQHDLDPMPEHYGCSVDVINPADRELLDVIVADDRPYARGERTSVRVVDMLERGDGDHKLLALPVDVAVFDATTLRRLERARAAVWDWYTAQRKPIVRWAGEEGALETLAACRAWSEAHR